MAQVSVTDFRPQVAKWIERVRTSPSEYVILTAHGREVAALVGMETMKLVWSAQDERRVGPIDPATGRPFGSAWVGERFQGHYERARDPESHLHPSREEAPWLGRPFDWPRPEEPRPRAAAEPPAPRRRWWQVWRR